MTNLDNNSDNRCAIEVKNLVYSFPDGTRALNGIDLRIKRGAKVAFLGSNGAGKSTLFLHFNGSLKPTSGTVLLDGAPLSYDASSLQSIRKNVGMVFQNPDEQVFAPTVKQDVAFGPLNLDIPQDVVRVDVDNVLRLVGMDRFAEKPPHHLSRGQKKRVAIAGVLVMEPDAIVLDEPTSDLDPVGSEEMMELLDELNQHGKTIIISTHDVELAYRWADYIYVLNGGKVVAEGNPQKMFAHKDILKESRLKLPFLLDMYNMLKDRHLIVDRSPPTSALGLLDSIEMKGLKNACCSDEVAAGDRVSLIRMKEKGGTTEDNESDIPGNSDGGLSNTIFARKDATGDGIVVHSGDGQRIIVKGAENCLGTVGRIFIYNMDFFNRNELIRLIEENDFCVGAMGSKPKLLMAEEHIPMDEVSDVINKSLLNTMCGRDCLILTNGGMVGHARKRIVKYCTKSNIDIMVELVN
ncbi:MAG: ATP-binding cassette domain-containing protein [Methanosarcinales archaeon]|nr:ATP-binding cassette domain-containing protein [Methanosarcinales archaeon]